MKKMKLLLVVGLLLNIVVVVYLGLGIPQFWLMRQIIRQHNLVWVDVTQWKESHFGKRTTYDAHFVYDGKASSVRVSSAFFSQSKDSKRIQLIHSKNYKKIFISEDYDINTQAFAMGGVLLVFTLSLFCIIYYLRYV